MALVPAGGVIVDVGCDHGHVTHALGAIGVERAVDALPRRPGLFVLADGLAPFRHVDTAVIAGMGPSSVLGIVDRGPAPDTLVVHCPDGMNRLRQGLADRGYRIDAERLARKGQRISEVVRVVRGSEPHGGHRLWFGPLLEGDPLVEALADHLAQRFPALQRQAPAGTGAHQRARAWVDWLGAGRPD